MKYFSILLTASLLGCSSPKVDSRSCGQFKLQCRGSAGWEDIEGLRITRRGSAELTATFGAVRADCIRLVVTATPGNTSRIWEVELYNPPLAD